MSPRLEDALLAISDKRPSDNAQLVARKALTDWLDRAQWGNPNIARLKRPNPFTARDLAGFTDAGLAILIDHARVLARAEYGARACELYLVLASDDDRMFAAPKLSGKRVARTIHRALTGEAERRVAAYRAGIKLLAKSLR